MHRHAPRVATVTAAAGHIASFSTTQPQLQQQRFDEFWSQHGLPGQSPPNYKPASAAPDLYKTPVDKGTGTSHTTDPYIRNLPNVHLSPPVSSVTTASAAAADVKQKKNWDSRKLANHWAPLSEWFCPSTTTEDSSSSSSKKNAGGEPLMLTFLGKLRVPLPSLVKLEQIGVTGGSNPVGTDYLKMTPLDVTNAVSQFPALGALQQELQSATKTLPSEFEVERFRNAISEVIASSSVCREVGLVPANNAVAKRTQSEESAAEGATPTVDQVLAVLAQSVGAHNALVQQWESAVKSRLSAGPQLWSSFFAQVEQNWDKMFLPSGAASSEQGDVIEGGSIYPNPADPRMHCTTHPVKALWEQAASGGEVKQPPAMKPSAALYFLHVITSSNLSSNSTAAQQAKNNLQSCGGHINAALEVASMDVNSALFRSSFPKSPSDMEGVSKSTIGQNLSQLTAMRHHLFTNRDNLLNRIVDEGSSSSSSMVLKSAAQVPHFPRQVLEAVQLLVAMQSTKLHDQGLMDDLVQAFLGFETDSKNIVSQLASAEKTKEHVKKVLGVGGSSDGNSASSNASGSRSTGGMQWIFSASTRWRNDRRNVLTEIFSSTDCLSEAKHLVSNQLNTTRTSKVEARMAQRGPISKLTIGKIENLTTSLDASLMKVRSTERNVLDAIADSPDMLPLLAWYEKLGMGFDATASASGPADAAAPTAMPVASLITEVERRHPAWVENNVFDVSEEEAASPDSSSSVQDLETLVKIFVRLTVLPQTAEAVLRQRYQRRMGPVGKEATQHNIPVEVGQAEHTNNQEYKQYDWQGWYQRMWDIHLRNVTMRIRLSDLKGSLANDGHPFLDMQGERRLRILSGDRVGSGIVKLDSDRYEDREHNWEHGHFKAQQLFSESRKTLLGKEYWPTVEVKVRKPSGQSKMHYSTLDWDRVEEEAAVNYKTYVAKKKEVISVQPQMTWLQVPEEADIYPTGAGGVADEGGPRGEKTNAEEAPKALGSNLFINAEDLFNELE